MRERKQMPNIPIKECDQLVKRSLILDEEGNGRIEVYSACKQTRDLSEMHWSGCGFGDKSYPSGGKTKKENKG
jgi:hypothetical protein